MNFRAIHHRPFLFIFVSALCVRFAYFALNFTTGDISNYMMEDSHGFLINAEILARGGTLLGFDGIPNYDPSAMPIPITLLALCLWSGIGLFGYLIIQILADSLACVLIAQLAGEASKRYLLLAGTLAALNPTQILLSNLVLTDTIFFLLSVLSLLAFVQLVNRKTGSKHRYAVVLGISVGAAALCRTSILPWVPVCVTASLIILMLRFGVMPAIRNTILTSVLFIMLVAPIGIRNHIAYDNFALTSQGGTHLLFWVMPLTADYGTGRSREESANEAWRRLQQRPSYKESQASPFASSDLKSALGLEMLWELGPAAIIKSWLVGSTLNLALPATTITPAIRNIPHESFYNAKGDTIIAKVWRYLTHADNRAYVLVNLIGLIGALTWLCLLPLGLWEIIRKAPLAGLAMFLWIGVTLGINGPVASPKYRLPMESAYVVFVAAGLLRARQTVQKSSRSQ